MSGQVELVLNGLKPFSNDNTTETGSDKVPWDQGYLNKFICNVFFFFV